MWEFPQPDKSIYEKPTANIILIGERLNTCLTRWGAKQKCPLFLLLFNVLLEVLPMEVKQENEIRGIHIGKEEVKLSLFTGDMICL